MTPIGSSQNGGLSEQLGDDAEIIRFLTQPREKPPIRFSGYTPVIGIHEDTGEPIRHTYPEDIMERINQMNAMAEDPHCWPPSHSASEEIWFALDLHFAAGDDAKQERIVRQERLRRLQRLVYPEGWNATRRADLAEIFSPAQKEPCTSDPQTDSSILPAQPETETSSHQPLPQSASPESGEATPDQSKFETLNPPREFSVKAIMADTELELTPEKSIIIVDASQEQVINLLLKYEDKIRSGCACAQVTGNDGMWLVIIRADVPFTPPMV